MTAKPNKDMRTHAPSLPTCRLPVFFKRISLGQDLGSIPPDHTSDVASANSREPTPSHEPRNLIKRDESNDPSNTLEALQIEVPRSDAMEVKVFRSPRLAPSSEKSFEPVFVALIRNNHQAWLAFPIANFSHNSPNQNTLRDDLETQEMPLPTNANLKQSLRCESNLPELLPEQTWVNLLPTLSFLPDQGPLRDQQTKELADLTEALANSKIVVSDGLLWHVSRSRTWTTAAQPLFESQPPPSVVIQDWKRQCRAIAAKKIAAPKKSNDEGVSRTTDYAVRDQLHAASLPDSPCHYLLSYHGLLFPIRALHEQLLQSLGIQPAEPHIDWLLDWGEQPVEIDWPGSPSSASSLQPQKAQETSSTTQANEFPFQKRLSIPTKKKKYNRQRLVVALVAGTTATITMLCCSSLLTTPATKNPSGSKTNSSNLATSNNTHSSSNHTEAANSLTSQPELKETTDPTELSVTPALDSSDALKPLSPDQIVLQSLSTSETTKRYAPVNPALTQAPSDLVSRDSLAPGNEAMGGELLGDTEPNNAGAADGDLVLEPPPGDLFIIPATKAFQRVELKSNPQATKNTPDNFSKNRPCWAQLNLSKEAVSEVTVQPSEFEVASSDVPAKWRVTFDDVLPELHVYLLTKPGRRWYFMVQVGVQFPGDMSPLPLGRDDAANALLKLQAHQQWLAQSIELLRNSPFPKRVPGRPDIFTQIRDLQSQQKETNKAIEQWTEVVRLCHELYSYGSIAIALEDPPQDPLIEDAP